MKTLHTFAIALAVTFRSLACACGIHRYPEKPTGGNWQPNGQRQAKATLLYHCSCGHVRRETRDNLSYAEVVQQVKSLTPHCP